MPEDILEINPQVHLRANRGTSWEGRAPETYREDHKCLAERLEGPSGSLRFDGTRPCQ